MTNLLSVLEEGDIAWITQLESFPERVEVMYQFEGMVHVRREGEKCQAFCNKTGTPSSLYPSKSSIFERMVPNHEYLEIAYNRRKTAERLKDLAHRIKYGGWQQSTLDNIEDFVDSFS